MLMYLSAIIGFVLLFGGGEFLVRGAVMISRRFGLSPLLIGMTVVAWCTSAPELVVSLGAALEGRPDIAVGNVVGSNIFNILGVLGIAAVIAPILVNPLELRRDTAVMIASAVALALIALTGEIGRPAGVLLLIGVAAYVVLSYRAEVRKPDSPPAVLHEHISEEIQVEGGAVKAISMIVGSLVALVIGAQLLIDGASTIARTFGVSEAVIGLSLIAAGTSLPELATSIMAAIRRHHGVAVGNVVGSNIFNILGILGISALVMPVNVADQIASVDVWVMVGVSLFLTGLLLLRGSIGRIMGAFLILAYATYLYWLF